MRDIEKKQLTSKVQIHINYLSESYFAKLLDEDSRVTTYGLRLCNIHLLLCYTQNDCDKNLQVPIDCVSEREWNGLGIE